MINNNDNNQSTSMISSNSTANNTNNQPTIQSNHQTQQPVLLNVSTTAGAYQNGTQHIPIRIPLSFSLQQLKSGQIALVPNTSLTNSSTSNAAAGTGIANIQMANTNSQNVPVTFTNHQINQDQSQQNNNNEIQPNNSNNNNVTYVPTNVNFILQGNQVFTGKIG